MAGHAVSLSYNISLETIDKFWNGFLIGLLPASAMAVILEISIKRRKILKALRRTKGYLLYGSVLSSIIQSMIENSNVNGKFRQCGSFDIGINVIEDIISIEEKKRNQTYFWILAILLMSFGKFYEVLKSYFPDIDNVIPLLEIISGIIQYLPR